MAASVCPFCHEELNSFRPVHGDDVLITFVNNIPVHSGHCETEILRRNPKKTRITSFPSPLDLTRKYGL